MQQPLQLSVVETPSSAIAGPVGRAGPVDRTDASLSFDERLQESSRAAATEQAATTGDVVESESLAAEITGNILPPYGSRSPFDEGIPSPGTPGTGISTSTVSSPVSQGPDGAGPDEPPAPDIAGAGAPPDGHSDIDVPVATPAVSVPPATDRSPPMNAGIAESVAVSDSGSPASTASGSTGSGTREQTANGDPGLPAQVAGSAAIALRPAVAANAAEVPRRPPSTHPPGDRADSQQRAAVNIDATRGREFVTDARAGGSGGFVDSTPQSRAADAPSAAPTRGELPVQRTAAETAASSPRSRSPETLVTQVAEASPAIPQRTPATDSLAANRGVPDVADRRGPSELPGATRSDSVVPGTDNPGNRRADSVGRFVSELQEAGMLSGDAPKSKAPSALPPAPPQSAPVTSTVAASLHPSSAAPAPQAPSPVFTVNAPVLDPAWEAAVNDRVVWLAGRNIPSAEIRLNPADLGPLQVQLSVDEKSVNVTFNAAHAVTREALESALPRLKDLLLESGMSLEGASVSDHGIGHQGNGGEQGENASAGEWFDDNDVSTGSDQPLSQQRARDVQGLVDTYA